MVFGTLAERFAIKPRGAGLRAGRIRRRRGRRRDFGAGAVLLAGNRHAKLPKSPTLGLLDALQAYTGLTLAVFDGSVDADGNSRRDAGRCGSRRKRRGRSRGIRGRPHGRRWRHCLATRWGPPSRSPRTPANALRVDVERPRRAAAPGPATFDTFALVAALRGRRLDRRVRDVGRSRLRPGGAFFARWRGRLRSGLACPELRPAIRRGRARPPSTRRACGAGGRALSR